MHELSIMTQIVDAILKEVAKHRVVSVKAVTLEVGKLAFLNPEQLEFCYGVLSEDNILKGSKLSIFEKKPKVKCDTCGYEGPIKYQEGAMYHSVFPIFACPECNGSIAVTEGRGCIIRNVTMDLED